MQSMAEKGFTETQSRDPERTLADAPPAVTFLMITYLEMLQDSRICALLNLYRPRGPLTSWPTDLPSPALLALLFDDSYEIRSWAQSQCALCEVAPIPMESFSSSHVTVLKAAADCISSSRPLRDSLGEAFKITWLQGTPPIWTGFTTLLRFVPIELLRSSRSFDLDVRHIIVGHLHDTRNRQPFAICSKSVTY